jgi:hypothetical protein
VTDDSIVPIAVLDTSVLVPVWSRMMLQRLASRPQPSYVPAWSEWIIAETWRTLALRWLRQSNEPDEVVWPSLTHGANEMLQHLLPIMKFVSLRDYAGPDAWPQLSDPNDVPIWQTAVLAGAQYVVSQNTRHFPPLVQGHHTYLGIEYLTGIEFIEDILGEDATQLHRRPLPAAASLRSQRLR